MKTTEYKVQSDKEKLEKELEQTMLEIQYYDIGEDGRDWLIKLMSEKRFLLEKIAMHGI